MAAAEILTDAISPPNRLSYWQSQVAPIFADQSFACSFESGHNFHAKAKAVISGDVAVFDMQFDAHTMQRKATRRVTPTYLIALQARGEVRITDALGECKLNAADFTIVSVEQEFEMSFSHGSRLLVFRLPPGLEQECGLLSRQFCGRPYQGNRGLGRIASNTLLSSARDLVHLSSRQANRLIQSVLQITAQAALDSFEDCSANTSQYRALQYIRLTEFIAQNLAHPDLSPAFISEQVGLSVRTINRILRGHGTSIGRLIWSMRLERCKSDLVDSRLTQQSVTQIAMTWGFKSPSHFSRAFQKKYGVAPRTLNRWGSVCEPNSAKT